MKKKIQTSTSYTSLNEKKNRQTLIELFNNWPSSDEFRMRNLGLFQNRINLMRILFMNELSDVFHEEMEDPIITMATPAVDWNNAWDYNSLAQITDGLFIMGYNYFYSSSSTAGPVSPLGGYYYDLEYTLNDYIQKTEGQLDKIILGLPYYGYDWPVIDDEENSFTTGIGVARVYSTAESMANNFGSMWNSESISQWFSYQNDLDWNQCWYDDSLSLSHKYQFAIDSDIAGVGIWALGYDNGNDELWGALYDKFVYLLEGDINNIGRLSLVCYLRHKMLNCKTKKLKTKN